MLFIYDALFNQDKVEHILVRHEQAALHAADGYARSTDEVGVALVTSGPGATNAVTGVRHGLHGFHPAGDHQRPGADQLHQTLFRKWIRSVLPVPALNTIFW